MKEYAMLEDFLIILDLYDGPMRGIVFYQRVPHVFERYEDESKGTFLDVFCLSPLSSELLPTAYKIYELSNKAIAGGKVRSQLEERIFQKLIDFIYPVQVDKNSCFDRPFRVHYPEVEDGNFLTHQYKIEWLEENESQSDAKV
jgi:hypothetical protein